MNKEVWVGRSDARIAQAAEAVGVTTDNVFGTILHDGHVLVFYALDAEGRMARAKFRYDDDEILERVCEDVEIEDPLGVMKEPRRLFDDLE